MATLDEQASSDRQLGRERVLSWYAVMVNAAKHLSKKDRVSLDEWDTWRLRDGDLGTSDWPRWGEFIDLDTFWPWPEQRQPGLWIYEQQHGRPERVTAPILSLRPLIPRAADGPVVYFHWDDNGDLLYVGSTTAFRRRQYAHRRDSPWWSEVAEIEVEACPDREVMLRRETALIRSEKPLYNIVGHR